MTRDVATLDTIPQIEREIDAALRALATRPVFEAPGSFMSRMSLEVWIGKLRQRKREVEWA